jgi:hypothetical protein
MVERILTETVTESVHFDSNAADAFRVASDASLIPSWAPDFAREIRRIRDDEWQVTRGDERFNLRVIADEESGTIDFVRHVAPGVSGGARLRIAGDLDGGCVVRMTAPITGGSTAEAVATIVRSELLALRGLVDRNQ